MLIVVVELAVVGKVEVLIVDSELKALFVVGAEPAIAVIKACVDEGEVKLVGFVGKAGSVFVVSEEASFVTGVVVSGIVCKAWQKVSASV